MIEIEQKNENTLAGSGRKDKHNYLEAYNGCSKAMKSEAFLAR